MRKSIVTLGLVVAMALAVAAAQASSVGVMERDNAPSRNLVAGAAPNGTLTQAIPSTAATAIIDLTGELWYEVYSSTDFKVRFMPTSARGAYVQHTVKAGTFSHYVNRATPFMSLSSATGTILKQ